MKSWNKLLEDKPFFFGGAASGDNFTDREKETERLLGNFTHGVSTILISPRRWGKTSLVKKASALAASDRLKVVYLDIFSCRSDAEFYDAFATAVLKQTASKFDEITENVKLFLSRISVKLNVGTEPMHDFSISLAIDPKKNDPDEVLSLPQKIAEKRGVRIVICIDEFQQIAEFRDSKTFQKRLRTVWQHQSEVSYCLFGSRQHLMNELFEKKSLPFYKFGDAIHLTKIPTDNWVEYICGRFESTGKKISRELAVEICETVDNHSYYVQQLSWLVWFYTRGEEATGQNFADARADIVDQNTPLFEEQTQNLSSHQMNFLRALVDGVHGEFTSQDILHRYQLGSSANVSVVKRALVKKELIEIVGKQVYLADPVMRQWLIRAFRF